MIRPTYSTESESELSEKYIKYLDLRCLLTWLTFAFDDWITSLDLSMLQCSFAGPLRIDLLTGSDAHAKTNLLLVKKK